MFNKPNITATIDPTHTKAFTAPLPILISALSFFCFVFLHLIYTIKLLKHRDVSLVKIISGVDFDLMLANIKREEYPLLTSLINKFQIAFVVCAIVSMLIIFFIRLS